MVILRGPESYLRRSYTQQVETALRTAHGSVDRFEYDGRNVDTATVLDELRTYALLQEHKLVVVDHADQFLAAAGGSGSGPTTRELVEAYAANPVDSATLILRAETWRPGKLDKAVEKVGAIIKCEAPDSAAAARWCIARVDRAHGAVLDPAAARLLVERIGPSLDRLDSELGKLAAHAETGATIGADAVRSMVGLSREEKAWQIQEVLLGAPIGTGIRTVRELLEVSRQPEQLILWSITDLARKLHAASRLLKSGESPGAVRKELRLFGAAAGPILDRARRMEPAAAARLVEAALEADRNSKRGIGRSDRTLETLVVRFADTSV